MANRKLTVRATRRFNEYADGAEALVEETADVKAAIKAKLLVVLSVESDGKEPKPAKAKADV